MRKAIFFDVDGTLIAGQTQRELSRVMFDAGIIHFGHLARIFLWHCGYKVGFFQNTIPLRKKFYRFFSKQKKTQMDSLILKTYQTRISPLIRESFRSIAQKFKDQKYITIAISGTLQQFCDLIKKEFALDYAFGTKLCTGTDSYSASWEGEVMEGVEKAKFIEKLANNMNLDLKNSIFYGDSYSDIPAMKLFGKSVAVMPDRRLARFAKKTGWEILDARNF